MSAESSLFALRKDRPAKLFAERLGIYFRLTRRSCQRGAAATPLMNNTAKTTSIHPTAPETADGSTLSHHHARVCRPQRHQKKERVSCLDETWPQNDIARAVWNSLQMLHLSPLYAATPVTDSKIGRNAIAPEILRTLWLMAMIDTSGICALEMVAQNGLRILASAGRSLFRRKPKPKQVAVQLRSAWLGSAMSGLRKL